MRVSDRDSFLIARRLAREEGILAGGSGGTSVFAMLETAKRFGPEATILTTIPDGGRGYLSKLFDDNWMLEHGFLERYGPADTVEQVLTFKHADGGVPDLVVCESHQKLGAAIELMQRYGISQLPVVRNAPAETLSRRGRVAERARPTRPRLPQPGRARGGGRESRWGRRSRPSTSATASSRSSATCASSARRSSSRATDSREAVLTRSDLLEYLAHRR